MTGGTKTPKCWLVPLGWNLGILNNPWCIWLSPEKDECQPGSHTAWKQDIWNHQALQFAHGFFPQLHTSDDPSTHLMTSTTGIPQQPSFQISRGHRPKSSWPAGGGGNDSCSAISGGFHPKNRRVSKDEANMAILIRKTCRLCRLCIKDFGVIHGRNPVGSWFQIWHNKFDKAKSHMGKKQSVW
jgi:hypothetical protein